MKNYSNSAVTTADIEARAVSILEEAHSAISAADQKQDRQINQLRIALAAAFILNLALSVVIGMRVF